MKTKPPTLSKEQMEWMKDERCPTCGEKFIPDREAVVFGTKKWDGHTFKTGCKHMSENLRISIG